MAAPVLQIVFKTCSANARSSREIRSGGKCPESPDPENFSENKCEIPPAGAVTPVTALQTLGLFAVPTGYIFISCTGTGYNPINTGVLRVFDRLHFAKARFDRLR